MMPNGSWILVAALAAPSFTLGAAPIDDKDERYRRELARAQDLLKSGKAEESIKAFEEANELAGKKSAECYLGMSLANFRLHDYKDALKQAKKALENAETTHQRAEATYFIGSALMGLDRGDGKKLREAEPELRAAVELESDNATYRYQLGVALLRQRNDEAGIEQLETFLELAPGSARAAEVRGFIEHPPRAHPDYAPEFTLVAESGREISLENQRGRVLLIDFWATWCPPCVESVPDLKGLHRRYTDEPFTLLSVSVDQDESAWRAFIQENDMGWEHFREAKGEIVPLFLPDRIAIPTYVVVDSEGVVRDIVVGEGRRTIMRLRRQIEDRLEDLRVRP